MGRNAALQAEEGSARIGEGAGTWSARESPWRRPSRVPS